MMMYPSLFGGGSIVRASLVSLIDSLAYLYLISGYSGGNLLER